MVDWADLCEVLRTRAEELEVPGAAIGVVAGGDERVHAVGVTSLENPLEVTPDTLFQAGSITKTFTGTAAMTFVQTGELDLDVPVRTYLPELRLVDEDVATRVTTRHLLTHVGGWMGDYFDDLGDGDDALARLLDAVAELPQVTPLGALWSYNNAGFYLAGRVLEVLGGKPYEHVVRERVLEPLGMETTTMFPAEAMTRRFVVGHLATPDGIEVARPWPIGRAVNPAGGIVASVVELLRYARFHLGLLEGPLEPRMLEAMREIQAEAGGDADFVGLTWMIRDLDGTRLYTHGGATLGQMAWLELEPRHGYALVVLTNASRGVELITDARRAARAAFLGLDDPEPEVVDLPKAELLAYVGTYETSIARVHITLEGDVLVARTEMLGGFPRRDSPPSPSPPPTRLAFIGSDRCVQLEGRSRGSRSEFVRDEAGEIRWIRTGHRLMPRVAPLPA